MNKEQSDVRKMSQSPVQDIVVAALDRMKTHDAQLFRINVSERTLTHRLAVYLEAAFEGWHVDCEYNRDGDIPKSLQTKRGRKRVLPDIIVHKRGPKGPNLLVIEAKKSSDLTMKNKNSDYIKLRAYKDELQYSHTAFIVFCTDESVPRYMVDFTLPVRLTQH